MPESAIVVFGTTPPVDDLPVWTPPRVVDGEIDTHPRHVSPLDGQDVLHGGIVTDPREIEHIRARVEYAALPMWRRWTSRRPEGWR